LKVIAWNIRQGGGTRINKIFEVLKNENAHVIVLSEYRNNRNGALLRNKLLSIGYRHQFVTSSSSNVNSVMIASKLPGDGILHPNADPEYGDNIIELRFPFFGVLGGYFPHKKKHILFDYIHKTHIRSELPYLITGDFNSGKNFIDQRGNSFWYQEDLVRWEKCGYLDAFRLVRGDTKEYSWYSHQGNGFRYDHAYISPLLSEIIADCRYLHAYREKKISDHSPLVISFNTL